MYEVTNKQTGQRVALVEQPRYVRANDISGAFIQCERDQAQGVAINGEIFSLNNQLEGRPEAQLAEFDAGALLAEITKQAQDLLDIKAALCELDLSIEETERLAMM